MSVLINIEKLNFDKRDGLVPAVIQDYLTQKVLMLGWMNREAVQMTVSTGKVTFFSRSNNRIRVREVTPGNFLNVFSIRMDCSQDALLIQVKPNGPVCDSGNDTCFSEENKENEMQFLSYLQSFIDKRRQEMPAGSYTTSLFEKGTAKISQKVGEEAVETIIGAMANDNENFIYEAGDLLYHLVVLLSYKGFRIEDVVAELKKRHK
ncbi:MAG: bifunctional phosphoribosyl-AMP cyclohydrolase/phosphoribosyl-ATP diphosphatase HisIE [Mariniphaga sp.]|nr:bifunctional phosphoribosyl-AMP cyclohydrolase/phosphoribosyl-ATP diphosphatase HisIE [Mariniphaga sp.]MDD4226839.1 bifunctional phosphoribosyl-AMP cyclohydrolase/phosphoribosyl-ATP diphosphatase HisIE [Mariniphaga sp.]MDD4424528.1 bifunctional phosphoribosyl-AMP cyclohydrolase/phosphoribosyl-ATP diphosphatase HisIE [Mariniphaga sp.]